MENIPNYPDLWMRSTAWSARCRVRCWCEAGALAKEAGSPRAANIVMAGAATPFLPLRPDDGGRLRGRGVRPQGGAGRRDQPAGVCGRHGCGRRARLPDMGSLPDAVRQLLGAARSDGRRDI